MKNKYSKLVVTVLTAVCFMGCQEDGIIYPEANAEVAATYLNLDELSQSTIQVQGVEGSHILKVKSDEKWTLSSSQAWCSLLIQRVSNILRYPCPFLRIHGTSLVPQS